MSVVYPYNQEPEIPKTPTRNTNDDFTNDRKQIKSNVILEIICFIIGFLIGLTV